MNDNTDITSLVEQWRAVVKQRKALDDLSKQLKNGPEAELRSKILMYMDVQGMNGVKTACGTISRTTKNHLEMVDTEAFLRLQLQRMLTCLQEGRPLADALIMQKTPAKSNIFEMVKELTGSGKETMTDDQFNAIAAGFGIKLVSDTDVSFKSL